MTGECTLTDYSSILIENAETEPYFRVSIANFNQIELENQRKMTNNPVRHLDTRHTPDLCWTDVQ